jgi:hypothetical protein
MQSTLNYDCKSCSDSDKEVRGCSMKASVVIMAHGVKGYATRCPVIDTAEVHSYFQVFHYWEQGQYPNSGTWADQPNRLVESMEIIRGLTKNANTA